MESFGRYTILERLHVGALGELSRARDTRVGRTVALRVVSPLIADDETRRKALVADASAAKALSHPHVAALFDVGEEDGRLFLAHEYVTGRSLREHMTGTPLNPNLALEFAVQLADAVAEGHKLGLVHGNLGPSTVFVTPTEQTKIIGFGLSSWTTGGLGRKAIAEQLDSGQELSTRGANDIVPYMAPEQILTGRADPRSDVFSLGVVLHEMVTGCEPFGSATAEATAVNVMSVDPPPASRKNPALPGGFDAILARAMAKSLDARYPTAAEMAADLRALADQLHVRVTAAVSPWTDKPPERRRRLMPRRVTLTLLVLALIGAVGGGAWYWQDRVRALFSGGGSTPRPVLLVLPFQTSGAEAGRAYFGIGFAEDLAARLGEVPGLTVVARTGMASAATGGSAERPKRIGASVVLRGTTRPGPYSFHVDVELVDAATGRVLWSEKYAREPRQVPAAEVEIAREVADRLRLGMPAGDRWARTQVRQVDPGAYDQYLQARDAAARGDRTQAIAGFRRALEIDPKLFEARAGLSESLAQEAFSGGDVDPGLIDQARREAESALADDPEMPRAHVASALSAPTTAAAASSLARALSIDPSYAEAWHQAGDLLVELDPALAIACYRHSSSLDPAIDANQAGIAGAFEMLHRLPEAETALGNGRSADPLWPWWSEVRARLEIAGQHYDRAAEVMTGEAAAGSSPATWLVGRVIALAMAQRMDEARREVARLTDRYPGFCEGQAVAAALDADSNGAARARARALADAIFTRASSPDAPVQALPCAALAAAALGDGPTAAGYLARLASSERALREWTRAGILSPAFAFRRHLYPWSRVESSDVLMQASDALSQSLWRLREETSRRLPSPPQPGPDLNPRRQ